MRILIASLLIFIVLVLGFYFGKDFFIKKDYAIKINEFTMTKDEFEDYFKEMNISGEDTNKAREKVLDALISKKLMLQEAEKKGLHKSKEFLKTLETYYEQLLFKLVVDEKSKEIGSKVVVTDEEVRRKYEQLFEKSLVSKPLEEVYNQIKWQIFREKQTLVLSNWLEEIKKKAKIEINRDVILKK